MDTFTIIVGVLIIAGLVISLILRRSEPFLLAFYVMFVIAVFQIEGEMGIRILTLAIFTIAFIGLWALFLWIQRKINERRG
ncbi:MAG: hypothetical protein IIZ33_05985 [Erysipelotrichaceae bacterium]|nr:hypothetical protein [Erysipelotrichaceae bacterium]